MNVRVMLVRDAGLGDEIVLDTPQAAVDLLRPRFDGLDREHLLRVDVDARHRALGVELVSIGSLTSAIVHPREVLKAAILANAGGFFLAHNHPSGDPTPSPEDRETTRRIKLAGAILGIPMLDHIIMAERGYFSFQERGLL